MSTPTERAREIDAPAPTESGEPQVIEDVAAAMYDEYRVGRFGGGEYLPMWHELPEVGSPKAAYRLRAGVIVGARPVSESAREVERLRRALEELFPVAEGFTEAFDDLERLGLLVEVPADETFREEWDADTMYVWAWSALADEQGREP